MLELLASDYRSDIQDVLAFVLILVAFIWGGWPERAVAATWLICFEVAVRVKSYFWEDSRQLLEVDVFLASTDIVAGVFWIGIALYANRNYTLWIAAMQILAMSAHVARGLAESISPIGYTVMVVAPGWFQLIFLGIGLTRHILRKRKYGPYRDWRTVKNRPVPKSPSDGPKLFASAFNNVRNTWRDELK